MASTYEKYAPYRNEELTEDEYAVWKKRDSEEKELVKNPPSEQDRRPGGYIRDGKFHMYPMMEFHVSTAMKRAKDQMDGWAYPEDENICERYPGIDPQGKYSSYEMEFTKREMDIRAALFVRPESVRMQVESMLDQAHIQTEDNSIRALHSKMQKDSIVIRNMERGAKLCLDSTASGQMEKNAAEHAKQCTSFQEYDRFLTGLEQMCGLRREPYTQEMHDFFAERLGLALTHDRVERLIDEPDVQPASIQVEFANFDHQMEQRFFSAPRNWGKKSANMRDIKPGDPEYTDYETLANASMSPYAIETAARTMEPLFSKLEARSLRTDDINRINGRDSAANYSNMVNRGNLIIVDGQTVKERMQADYRKEKIEEPFENWYRKNLRERTGAYVSAALMAEQRVEVFIPDEKGRLPREPIEVTKKGYTPSPLRSMEALFSGLEARSLKTDDINRSKGSRASYSNMVNRGNLIIVGGQTVKEKMQADYRKEKIEEPFEDWYRKNLRERTGAYVSAALKEGQRVEAFIPDEKGRLPKEPVEVTRDGYAQSPLKKVTMNAWERHFSKYGFFKKKVEKMEAYKAALAARERVRDAYTNARLDAVLGTSTEMRDMFFSPEALKREGIEPGEYSQLQFLQPRDEEVTTLSIGRQTAISLCVAHMLAQGHDIYDIINPGKLVQERYEAGNLCIEKLKTGDYEWQGRIMFEGHKKMAEVMNNLTEGVDLRDPNARRDLLPMLHVVGSAGFDLSQEFRKRLPGYYQAARDSGYNDAAVDNLLNKVIDASSFVDVMTNLQKAESTVRKPISQWNMSKGEILTNVYEGAVMLGHLRDGKNLEEQLKGFPSSATGMNVASSRGIAMAYYASDFNDAYNSAKGIDAGYEMMHQAALDGKLTGGLIKGELEMTKTANTVSNPVFVSSVKDGKLTVREETQTLAEEKRVPKFKIDRNLDKKMSLQRVMEAAQVKKEQWDAELQARKARAAQAAALERPQEEAKTAAVKGPQKAPGMRR